MFGVDERGTRHPLDVMAPVYVVREEQQGGDTLQVRRSILVDAGEGNDAYRGAMVTHYATCKFANEFGKGKKPGGGPAEPAGKDEAAPGGARPTPEPPANPYGKSLADDLLCQCGAKIQHTKGSAVCLERGRREP